MARLKLKGKELIRLGYPEGPAIGMAINMMLKHYKRSSKEEVMAILQSILEKPEEYADDPVLGRIAAEILGPPEKEKMLLKEEAIPYEIYGESAIEKQALEQMDRAMRLPVTEAGALMADAHQGYGLPIGGVLATENSVIPYGVGMDIGCRMCLSIYDLKPEFLVQHRVKLKKHLLDNTRFGVDEFSKPMDDAVMERSEFKEIPKLKSLKNKAYRQIGTSGSGNHFVEFGLVEITDPGNEFELPLGTYVGLLSHSGSRNFGATIAQHYTKLARELSSLPKEAMQLAWLDLDTEAGMEYWLAMNLAGDYASACHSHIHHRLSKALGEKAIAMVENHHNFAWKESLVDGREVIVHRKGATPATKGVLGVIPGSMTAPGFIVRGKGNLLSLNSASHGAGRKMSRRAAKESHTESQLRKYLAIKGVELLGGGLDEVPGAYKNIHHVMAAQSDLVDVVGSFLPKIVRMAE